MDILRQRVPFFFQHCSGYYDIVNGTSPLLLPKAKANGLKSVKLFGGTEQSNLQAGFTQLEYIESTGTQYIDTGIVLKSKATVTTVAQFVSITQSAAPFTIWGFLGGGSNLPRWGCSSLSGTWLMDLNNTTTRISSDINKHTFVNETDGTTTYNSFVDGNSLYTSAQAIISVEKYTSNTLSAYIFARNNNGRAGNFSTARIFSFNIVQDNVLVINLLPAKRNSDNVIGMYDTVSNTFLVNQGTGTFTAGQAVVPTPDAPIDIISNNGALKYSANMANVNAQTALIGYYISAQGVVTKDMYNWIYQSFIPVKPNTTYTLSMSSSVYYVSISEYSTADNSSFIVRKVGSTGSNTQLTITTGANTNFVRFGTNIDRTEVTLEEVLAINWMLNEGGTAIPYAPYAEGGIYTDGTVETVTDNVGNVATAQMLLSLGAYKDTQEVLTGAVTRNVGILVLDGTERWTLNSNRFRVQNLVPVSESNVMACSHFAFTGNLTTDNTIYRALDSSWFQVRYDTANNDVTTFTNFLADQYANGTPVIVVYPLATPTTETVTPQTLQVQAGTNILQITQASIDNLPLEVTYKRGK